MGPGLVATERAVAILERRIPVLSWLATQKFDPEDVFILMQIHAGRMAFRTTHRVEDVACCAGTGQSAYDLRLRIARLSRRGIGCGNR